MCKLRAHNLLSNQVCGGSFCLEAPEQCNQILLAANCHARQLDLLPSTKCHDLDFHYIAILAVFTGVLWRPVLTIHCLSHHVIFVPHSPTMSSTMSSMSWTFTLYSLLLSISLSTIFYYYIFSDIYSVYSLLSSAHLQIVSPNDRAVTVHFVAGSLSERCLTVAASARSPRSPPWPVGD